MTQLLPSAFQKDRSLPAATWRRLVWLRAVAVLVQVVAILFAEAGLGLQLPLSRLAAVVAVLAMSNLVVWHLTARGGGREAAFAALLAFDLIGLTLLLFLTGGHTNPFVSLYLLPLAVAGAVLTSRYVWPLAALAVASYTLLVFRYRPLPDSHLAGAFDLHLAGMWVSFVSGVLIIGCFFLPLAQSLRQREAALATARERLLRHERAVAVGAVAAGAAHELATPLNSVALILDDLREQLGGNAALSADLDLAGSQLHACREILERTLRAPAAATVQSESLDCGTVLRQIAGDWRALNPGCTLGLSIPAYGLPPLDVPSDLFRQILFTLLDNARDYGSGFANLEAQPLLRRSDEPGLRLAVSNAVRGAGDEPSGHGVGLLLATTVAESWGGRLWLEPIAGQGMRAVLELPPAAPAHAGNRDANAEIENAAAVAG